VSVPTYKLGPRAVDLPAIRNRIIQTTLLMTRRRLVCTGAIGLAFGPLFLGCQSARTATPKAKPELAEREAFIRTAMEEHSGRGIAKLLFPNDVTNQQIAEASVAGIMRVTKLVPFADWDFYWVMGGSINWQPNAGQTFKEVYVPEGFVTDLASIPRLFWQILRPVGRHAFAAVVHDYLYWTQTRPRSEADQIFKVAMEDSKVESGTAQAVYQAVHQFGQTAWDDNRRLRRTGERRFLQRFPTDFTISWSEWKKRPDVFRDEL
jgi:hypothetical protein